MKFAIALARIAYRMMRIMVGYPPKARWKLLRSYVALQLKVHTTSFRSKRRLCRTNLLGFRINSFTYPTLIFLIDEIFVARSYYFKALCESPLIVDLGSNIGVSVLFFKWLYPRARIIAFEPDSETFGLLKKNVEENHLKDVRLYNMAVYDSESTIPFYYDPDAPGQFAMSTRKERLPKASRTVQSTLLSSYIEEQVDFLKMDIEGAEIKVIGELSAHNKLRSVKEMVIEYHHHITPETNELSEILNMLEENGFGYQLTSQRLTGPFERGEFQDILIYAYRNEPMAQTCCSEPVASSTA